MNGLSFPKSAGRVRPICTQLYRACLVPVLSAASPRPPGRAHPAHTQSSGLQKRGSGSPLSARPQPGALIFWASTPFLIPPAAPSHSMQGQPLWAIEEGSLGKLGLQAPGAKPAGPLWVHPALHPLNKHSSLHSEHCAKSQGSMRPWAM